MYFSHSNMTNGGSSKVRLNMSSQYKFELNNCFSNMSQQTKRPVGIFWDLENCTIPRGVNTFALVGKIRKFCHQLNLLERNFSVVCDVFGFNQTLINELNDMQLNVVHICSFSKNASDEKLKQLVSRFVTTHSHECAVLLLTSDINFAPLLSDLKNRLDVKVILFHHQQVSPALVACAHYSINFDIFCSHISSTSSQHSIEQDFKTTYLRISNLPRTYTEEWLRVILNRLINNSGGRLVTIDLQNNYAEVVFKCKSDAQRCMQRINNRHLCGHTMKASVVMSNQNQLGTSNIQSNQSPVFSVIPRFPVSTIMLKPQIKVPHQLNSADDSLYSSGKPKQFVNFSQPICNDRCEMCHLREPSSRYANYLTKGCTLDVHISLKELAHKMTCLLNDHNGKISLNALPHCWLVAFGQELDTTTKPKVMFEHLLSCLDNVAIETVELKLQQQAVITKFVVRRSSVSTNDLTMTMNKKLMNEMKLLSNRLFLMLVSSVPNPYTPFPSILLSSLSAKYQETYNELFRYEHFGVSSIEQLIPLLEHFNLYSYKSDYLIAFNHQKQIDCFIQDMYQVLQNSSQQSIAITEVDIDTLVHLFQQYFNIDLDVTIYGVCFIEDLLESIKQKENDSRSCSSTDLISPALWLKCESYLIKLLRTTSDLTLDLETLYTSLHYLSKTPKDSPLSDYSEFVKFLMSNYSKHLKVITDGDTHRLILRGRMRHLEFANRFVHLYHFLCWIGHHTRKQFVEGLNLVPLSDIFAYYLKESDSFNVKLHGISNLTKVFEKAIASLYKSGTSYQFVLIHADNDVLLLKCNDQWMQDQATLIFLFLFECSSYSLTWAQLTEIFQSKVGFSLGPSCLYHRHIRKMIFCSQVDGLLQVKLREVFEFAALCLTVMLLHKHRANQACNESGWWNLDQLDAEHYDHFGVPIAQPSMFELPDYKSLFEQLTVVFEVDNNCDHHSPLRIRFKQSHLKWISIKSLSSCNYCEQSLLQLKQSVGELNKN